MTGQATNRANASHLLNAVKNGGIDFLAIYPDSELAATQRAGLEDPDIQCIPVASEANGVATCAGAWLGGRQPALMMPTAGLTGASWPLTSLCLAKGIPVLLLIAFRGEVGDTPWYMGQYNLTTIPILDALGIPIVAADEVDQLERTVRSALASANAWQRPIAIMLSRRLFQ
jgi:sulfopyruvate decarboxylase subunit alpha